MGLEEDFKEFASEMRDDVKEGSEFRGMVKSNLLNLNSHLSAVSKKADAIRVELETHKKDDKAHGLGGEEKARGNIVAWAGVIFGVAGLLGPLIWIALGAR